MSQHKNLHAELRRTLGMFATGVAVVTALTPEGEPIGLTINSFNSVSLDPPLIVWSLARHLEHRPIFESCSHYAINILAAEQQSISQLFASKTPDKFSAIDYLPGQSGVPLIQECCAWFEVKNAVRHDGGDHILFLGQIEHFQKNAQHIEPLIFFAGAYRHLL